MKFEFSSEIPEYMKGFGFGPARTGEGTSDEDLDADLYGRGGLVEELNPENYSKVVQERGDILVVEIYNPRCGPCRDFKFEYLTAAQSAESVVPFAAVNCRRHRNVPICKQGKRYPSVYFFGPDKSSKPLLFTGKKKFEEILKFVAEQLSPYHTELNRANMERWLTRNPGKIKVVLFAVKRPAPVEWIVGAFRFRSQLDVGIIYPQEKDLIADYFTEATEYNAGKYVPYLQIPSLLKITDIDTLGGEWRTIRGIPADKFISHLGIIAAQSQVSSVNPLHPLTPRRMRAGECTVSDSQFCIILLLPNKTAAWGSARDAYSGMKELASKYKTDPVKLVYVDAEKHPDFAKAFGYDASSKKELLVAYRPKRKRYLTVGPSLDKQAIEEVIDKVLAGNQLPEVVKRPPNMNESTDRGRDSHDEL